MISSVDQNVGFQVLTLYLVQISSDNAQILPPECWKEYYSKACGIKVRGDVLTLLANRSNLCDVCSNIFKFQDEVY
jgi:hypothetical protein